MLLLYFKNNRRTSTKYFSQSLSHILLFPFVVSNIVYVTDVVKLPVLYMFVALIVCWNKSHKWIKVTYLQKLMFFLYNFYVHSKKYTKWSYAQCSLTLFMRDQSYHTVIAAAHPRTCDCNQFSNFVVKLTVHSTHIKLIS